MPPKAKKRGRNPGVANSRNSIENVKRNQRHVWMRRQKKKQQNPSAKKQLPLSEENGNEIPCNLCDLVLKDSTAFSKHQADPMHMELYDLLTMKETTMVYLVKNHAKLLTERENVKLEKKNPGSLTAKRCKSCSHDYKVRSPADTKSHESSTHHLVSKLYQCRSKQCFMCNEEMPSYTRYSQHITGPKHLKALAQLDRQDIHDHFEEVFNQEENLQKSCDKAIVFAEKLQGLKRKAKELSEDIDSYDPSRPYGVANITWKLKSFCLPCKLSLASNEGGSQEGIMISKVHCSMPEHYDKMSKFLQENAKEIMKIDKIQALDEINRDGNENREISSKSWQPFMDGMVTSEDGDLIYPDGTTVSSDFVEIKTDGSRQMYRMKSKPKAGVPSFLVARDAYLNLRQSLQNKHDDIVFTSEKLRYYNRTVSVALDNHLFSVPFLSHVEKEFSSFVNTGKFQWEEASRFIAFIPRETSMDVFPENFRETFSYKKMKPNVASEQLGLPCPDLPDNLLTQEFHARQSFLDSLSLLLLLESLALAATDDVNRDTLRAATKISLRPLTTAAQTFFKARLSLRRFALSRFNTRNPHVSDLLQSTPFCIRLFGTDVLGKILELASSQSKSIGSLLGSSFAV